MLERDIGNDAAADFISGLADTELDCWEPCLVHEIDSQHSLFYLANVTDIETIVFAA